MKQLNSTSFVSSSDSTELKCAAIHSMLKSVAVQQAIAHNKPIQFTFTLSMPFEKMMHRVKVECWQQDE